MAQDVCVLVNAEDRVRLAAISGDRSRPHTRHPRWVFHFTPTSGSWLNAVETFFSALTRRRLRRGVFRSVADLQAAINRYLKEHNNDPNPFVWTKSADSTLAKICRLPEPSQ